MAEGRTVVVIGGTSGLGMDLAQRYAGMGRRVVISGRDAERTAAIAKTMGGSVSGVALDLAEPAGIAAALEGIGEVDRLALAALERDQNTVKDYDISAAIRLATLKLIGYTEVVHALVSRLTQDASIVVYGGLAKLRPYVGSTTVTTVNAAVDGLVRTLAAELPPIRVNALHPGIVGDSPYWAEKTEALEAVKARTPTGRLVQMRDVTDAAMFLLENPSMHGGELRVDGGWSLS
jgi:NAD(P)-dependent dehydrogenase (short-subunit alcohol dehydrogenase family)